MTVVTNGEDLAFLRIGSSQVKVGAFGFALAWKKSPDLENLIETPK